jgi:hypothetical protein
MGCLVAAHVGLANKLQPVNETPAAGAQHKVFLLRPVDLCPPAGLLVHHEISLVNGPMCLQVCGARARHGIAPKQEPQKEKSDIDDCPLLTGRQCYD